MSEKNKSRSIFQVLLLPLLCILIIEVFVMIGVLFFGGAFNRLRQNAEDILQKQVENRGGYLLHEMNSNWSDLELLSDYINNCVQKKLENGEVTLEGLSIESEQYINLLNEMVPELIDSMYSKRVSGVFVVLNSEKGTQTDVLPGIYLRDLDPLAKPSEKQEDILVERAPRGVVQAGVLATDTGWQPMFLPEDGMEMPFFKTPYNTAALCEPKERLEAEEYGYWTTESYCLTGDSRPAISYSVPLMLEDGTIYGVLGVELLEEYLESILPVKELQEEKQGSYVLAYKTKNEDEFHPVMISGNLLNGKIEDENMYFVASEALEVYNSHAPFEDEEWYLLGCIPKKLLYKFSDQLQGSLIVSALLTLVVGLFGTLVVSYRISRPVQKLSVEVEKAQSQNQIPNLSSIKIFEIDQLVNAVTHLGREVLESSTRFLNIMNMASVELAGYEMKDESNSIYVTENYFRLLGMEDVKIDKMTAGEFLILQEQIGRTLKHKATEDGSILYTVPLENGEVRYLRSEEKKVGNRCIGLIEDVTSSVLEKKKIEHERDYDALTRMLSRQGFSRKAKNLFAKGACEKVSALLMLDLDNLKQINDKFGHNIGDLYIQTAGECFMNNVPENTLCARISGDEFLILYYGFERRDEIWEYVQLLYQQMRGLDFVLPDGFNSGISASGGLTWYPSDSKDISELMKFSDFAMYCVKKQERGNISEFDLTAYNEMLKKHQCRQEFYQLLELKRLNYHFQPIFDAKTGEPYAYEALMRVNMPNLKSPDMVIRIARETERMQDIETMTIFGASASYKRLLAQKEVAQNAYVFINSFANVSMTLENDRKYHEMYQDLQNRVVVEITEAENLDMELVRQKRNVEGFSGLLALDDYGSGYNTEINLLELEPNFVKVDITIIRNIHEDVNKQQLVTNIVEYAHKRDMKVIAEGLEYPEEVEKCLDLGVDLLQGYYLAKPGAIPPAISEESYALIQSYHSKI